MAPPLPQGVPPDVVVVSVALTILQVFEWIHRRSIGPRFQSYVTLPFRDKFDWDRRVNNLSFQLIQLIFNAYLILFDRNTRKDYLYGYSPIAHIGFLVIIAFYLYDSTGIVMHPSPSSRSVAWLTHHVIAVSLLLWVVSVKRSFAFPSAIFLISAAGHIPNELRWFIAATNVRNQALINTVLVLCFVITFVTCAVPPPYLLYRCAVQFGISIYNLIFFRMRVYCISVFSLIYIPHVFLVVHQLRRLHVHWNQPSEPFRTRKID